MGLKTILKSKGIKIKWFAKQIGVSVETVRPWLRGKTLPNVKYIPLIADALDSTVEEVTRALLEK